MKKFTRIFQVQKYIFMDKKFYNATNVTNYNKFQIV